MYRHRAAARRRRAGYLTPALAMAILAAFLVGALVLNIGWRRTAEREIVVAADAAALAAAAELACDERLLDGPLPQTRLDRITARAAELAGMHEIVGTPSVPTPDSIRIGRRVTREDGPPQFLDTDHAPTAVVLQVRRGETGELPWLFRAGGHTSAILSAQAEAGIDSRIASLRPRAGGTVPVWPIALRSDPAVPTSAEDVVSSESWSAQIGMKLGADRFGFDRATKRVVERPDGLPELVVFTLAPGGETDDVGVTLVDIGETFDADRLGMAMRDGLTAEDLGLFGGTVPVASLASAPVDADALPRLPIEAERNLTPGDVRAIFLFDRLVDAGGSFTARLNGVVAARLMDLRPTEDGAWRATFQPAVLAAGTAVLADADDADVPENRYLYKVRLTR